MMIISYALMGFCFATYNYMLLYFNELGNNDLRFKSTQICYSAFALFSILSVAISYYVLAYN